jgi:putative acetyltransferase
MAAVRSEAERLGASRLFAEVSVTARPFFERHGFVVLAEQQVVVRDVALVNYRMERRL